MPDRSLEEVASWAGSNGFDALELAAWPRLGERPFVARHVAADGFDDAEAERVRVALDENGLELSALAYYDNNLHPDPAQREAIHGHVRSCIDVAAALGAVPVGTFIGRDNCAQRGGEPPRGRARAASTGRVRRGARSQVDGGELRDGGVASGRVPGQPRVLAGALGVDVRARVLAQLLPLAPALDRDRSRRGAGALRGPRDPCARQGRRDVL